MTNFLVYYQVEGVLSTVPMRRMVEAENAAEAEEQLKAELSRMYAGKKIETEAVAMRNSKGNKS